MPTFMAKLREADSAAALALEFTILCATRTSETLGARWDEIDTDKRLWTIPRSRMKAGKEHRVPLSDSALAILKRMAKVRRGPFVFPGGNAKRPLSSMTMAMHLRRMDGYKVTVHGFRSSFRDWASEATSFPHEVCEAALAHAIKSKAESAYRRGDMLAKRAKLMNAWADYCEPKAAGKVIPLTRVVKR
jgi:integrase